MKNNKIIIHSSSTSFLFGFPRSILFWMMAVVFTVSGCTSITTVAIKDGFPVSNKNYPHGPNVSLIAVDEVVPQISAYAENENYLGDGVRFLGFVLFVPYGKSSTTFNADTTRVEAIRLGAVSYFKNAGIPVLEQSQGGLTQFQQLQEGELGLSLRLRKIEVNTNLDFIMPFITFNGFGFGDEDSRIIVDCQLWQAGNKTPLWEGLVDKTFDDDFHKSGGASLNLPAAVTLVIDECMQKSNLIVRRNALATERYALLMFQAEKMLGSGNNRAAMESYGQASVMALDSVESASAFNTMAREYHPLAQQLSLPEEARKFGVQAELAVRNKKLTEAVDLYRSQISVTPWWPQSHFNLALILGELKRNTEAIDEMQKYLLLAPNAANSRQAQDKIYVWEAL